MLSSSAAWLSAKLARRGQRARAREQELDALLGRRGVGEQAQRAARTSARRWPARAAPPPRRPRAAPRPRPRRPGAPSSSTWCARAAAGRAARRRAPRRSARARPAASRRASTRRPRGGRAGGGSGSGAGRRSAGRGRAEQLVERVERRVPRRVPAAAAASSGSNGSPATAAPSSTSRRVGATAARAPRPARRRRRRHLDPAERALAAAGRGAAAVAVERARELLEVERVAAALRVERVCRRAVDRLAEQLARLARASARRARAASSAPPRCARSSAAASRSGTWRGRTASAISTGAAGGRRSSAPSSSSEPESAQCRSSSTSTSGRVRGEPLEQLAHRAVAAVALVRAAPAPAAATRWTATGRTGASSAEHVVAERRRAARGSRPRTYSSSASTKTQNGRSRSSSDARAGEDEVPARVGARGELGEQARLADPGLADDRAAPPGLPASRCGRTPSIAADARRRGRRNGSNVPTSQATSRQPNTGRAVKISAQESGCPPDVGGRRRAACVGACPAILLHHGTTPDECGVVFASFRGHDSPLRRQPTLASCRSGGHAIWWTVEARHRAATRSPAAVLRRRAHRRRHASPRCGIP